MEAIKLKGIARNGELIILVPSYFNEQELEIIILSSNDKKDTDRLHEDKVKRLMSIVGTAKFPDLSPDLLDVYEQ